MTDQEFIRWYKQALSSGDPVGYIVNYIKQNQNDPEIDSFLRMLNNKVPSVFEKAWNTYLLDQMSSGALGGNDAYAEFSKYGISPNEESLNFINNLISRENTVADNSFQTSMRDTSLTSTANQLEQMGLSSSNVISIGGASSGLTSQPADVSRLQGSINRKQQLALNQYNQRMGMAKSLIGMAGSMASSGIYGHALGAAKHSAAALAAAASHSGLRIMQNRYDGFGNNTFSLSPDGLFTGK